LLLHSKDISYVIPDLPITVRINGRESGLESGFDWASGLNPEMKKRSIKIQNFIYLVGKSEASPGAL
jgi:hypothetical protein